MVVVKFEIRLDVEKTLANIGKMLFIFGTSDEEKVNGTHQGGGLDGTPGNKVKAIVGPGKIGVRA